jgi:hypothetical protein
MNIVVIASASASRIFWLFAGGMLSAPQPRLTAVSRKISSKPRGPVVVARVSVVGGGGGAGRGTGTATGAGVGGGAARGAAGALLVAGVASLASFELQPAAASAAMRTNDWIVIIRRG